MASNQMRRGDKTAEEREVRLPETGKVNIKAESAPGVNIKAESGRGGEGKPASVAKFEVAINAEAGAPGQGQREQQQSRQGTRLSQGQGPMLCPGGEGQQSGSYGAQGQRFGSEEKEKSAWGQQLGKNIGSGEPEKQRHDVKEQDIHAKAKQDMNKNAQDKDSMSSHVDQAKAKNITGQQQFGKQQDLHAKAKQDMNMSTQDKNYTSQQDDQAKGEKQKHEVKQQDLHAKAKQDINNETAKEESSQPKKTIYNKPGVSVIFHEDSDQKENPQEQKHGDRGKGTREQQGEQKPTMQDIMPSLIAAEDRYAKAKQSQPQKDTNKSENKQIMQDIMPSLIVAEDRYAKAKQSQPQKDTSKTSQEKDSRSIQQKQKPGMTEHDEQAKESQERRNIAVSKHGERAEKPQEHRHGDQTKQQNLHAKAKQSQLQKDTNKSTQEKQKPGAAKHDEQKKESQERRNIVVSEHGQRAENPQEHRHGDQKKHEQHSVIQQNLHAKAKQSQPQKDSNKSIQEKETTPKKPGVSATDQCDQGKQSQEWNRAVVSGHGDQTKLQQKQRFGAEDSNDKAKQSQPQRDTNKSSKEKSVQQKEATSKKSGVTDREKKPQEQQSKGHQRGVVNERDDEEDRWEVLEQAIGEEAENITEGVMQAVGETIVDIAKTTKDFVIGQDQHGATIAEGAKTGAPRVQLGGQHGQERVPEEEWEFQQGAKGFAGFSQQREAGIQGGWQDSSMEVLEPTIGGQAQDGGVLQAIGETLVDIAKTTKDFVIGQDQPGVAEGIVIKDGAAKGFAPKDLEAREQYAKTTEDRSAKDSKVREQYAKTVEERWTVGG